GRTNLASRLVPFYSESIRFLPDVGEKHVGKFLAIGLHDASLLLQISNRQGWGESRPQRQYGRLRQKLSPSRQAHPSFTISNSALLFSAVERHFTRRGAKECIFTAAVTGTFGRPRKEP